MCGIAGILGGADGLTILNRMLELQRHRGPDAGGARSINLHGQMPLVLGHRRLAIVDLSSAGLQPMSDSSEQYYLTFNGEIYNYLEVRAELVALGATFRSDTDTEVLLQAYKQWGVDCLLRFNGMFAFALYDSIRGVLFCARDRYGEKPFLFGFGKGFFAFASEYKALLQHPGLSLNFDEWRLIRAAHNQSTGLDADRQTVFNDVQQLLPGEAMEVDVRSMAHRTWNYWKIASVRPRLASDEREVFSEFRDLLVDSVRLRMRSDVPVGSCLSGGLDSSAIVCIARQLLGDDAPYQTFTGRFPGTEADEWQWARQVVDATNVVSHVVEPNVEGFVDELPNFLWYNELPVGSSSQYAQWNVFRLAKEHGVTVLLDGQGADETLGGYEQYFRQYVESLQQIGDTERLAREVPEILSRYPLAMTPASRSLRDRTPFSIRHAMSRHLGIGTSLLYGMRTRVASAVATEAKLSQIEDFNPLTNALMQDTFGRYLTTLLRYGDRNSMSHSREVRLPFCDHRIAEFVVKLPPHLLMGEVQTKRLLRESMRGILPEAIRTRWNKQGFRPPQDLWFRSPALLSLVRDTFHDQDFANSPYWIASWWQRALKRVEGGELGLGWTLWHPFMVEQWKRHVLEPLRASRQNAQ
jgi:asparagine synthase (glutamine-hydrolysing)